MGSQGRFDILQRAGEGRKAPTPQGRRRVMCDVGGRSRRRADPGWAGDGRDGAASVPRRRCRISSSASQSQELVQLTFIPPRRPKNPRPRTAMPSSPCPLTRPTPSTSTTRTPIRQPKASAPASSPRRPSSSPRTRASTAPPSSPPSRKQSAEVCSKVFGAKGRSWPTQGIHLMRRMGALEGRRAR